MEGLAPTAEFTSTARNGFFGKIKPVCIAISQLAIRPSENKAGTSKRLLELTEQLFDILESQVKYDAAVLDEKIADYAFFPLSHILRKEDQYPVRLIEATIKCLRILIHDGWSWRISKDLSQQLLILLTFIVGGVPNQERQREVPEETIIEGYRTLTALIGAAGKPAKDPPLTEDKIIPSLGHTISVTLEAITDGKSPEIQLVALEAINALYGTVKDDAALATFFPGTVSSLSRALSLPSSLHTQKRVLVSCLGVLNTVLTTVLGDMKTRTLQKEPKEANQTVTDEATTSKVLTPAWLKATVAQVKIALASILKLRSHDDGEVRRVLERFCISLLDECHASLVDSTTILVETAMILAPKEDSTMLGALDMQGISSFATSLQDLAGIYPELMDTVKTTVYNWTTSMPRIMQSSEEKAKQQAIHNLLRGNELIEALHIDSTTLQDSLASTLRDSIVALVLNSKQPRVFSEAGVVENSWEGSEVVQQASEVQSYQPILLWQESQRATRDDVYTLIQNIGSSSVQTKLAAEMLSYVRDSDGVDQVASYWLAFELLKASFSQTSAVDSFMDFSALASTPEDQESVFQELYSFSVSVLASHSDATDADWRLEATALEVAAFAASRLRSSFRPELIDTLYPIATFLGSQSQELRSHAITTLDMIAASCEYHSVSELIIDNVDYMVNSISLRLNTFDISPASTKVLIMMIRLTGPKLIPYLDDVVAAIFAALDNYHGYPLFVESLFAVLSEVVDQGVKSDMLLLEGTSQKALDHKKRPPAHTNMEDISGMLDERAKKRKRDKEEEDVEDVIRTHSDRLWKSASEELDDLAKRARGEEEEEEDSSRPEQDPPALPKTPTYSLLTRVTTLTQHYLTSPTPTLRKSLLELLAKVSPALAPDEEAFLPLVNAIWPVLVSRLHDPEPFVVISACKALGALCESAGDFLASRIKTEWWDSLGKWFRATKTEAVKAVSSAGKGRAAKHDSLASRGTLLGVANQSPGEMAGIVIPIRSASGDTETKIVESRSAGLGRFAQAVQVWDAASELLIEIVSFVRIDDDIFDQVLDLLGDGLARGNQKARNALEAVNADAVWLAMYQRGLLEAMPTPRMNGADFVSMEGGMAESIS